jgi:membrane-bound lytic murein transglycosylase D
LRSTRLRIGQRLTIYPRGGGPKKKTTSTAVSNKAKAGVQTYTVKNGDSLWSISQKFPGVTVENIRKWNDISGNKLKPGMKLKIQKG